MQSRASSTGVHFEQSGKQENFRSCFYTQFDELLPSPLLAMLLFGLLRIRVTN
jgi:hypothetical protein